MKPSIQIAEDVASALEARAAGRPIEEVAEAVLREALGLEREGRLAGEAGAPRGFRAEAEANGRTVVEEWIARYPESAPAFEGGLRGLQDYARNVLGLRGPAPTSQEKSKLLMQMFKSRANPGPDDG